MASKILIKRSTTAGAIPTAQQLSTGELAINLTDRKIYTNDNGTVKELGILPTTLDVTNNATVGGTFGVSGVSTLASGSVTGNFTVGGTLTVATPSNDTDAASKGYVDTAVAGVLDSAPGLLDTLNELAAAINDDPDFYNTITGLISEKVAKAGDTMTGDLVMGGNKVTSTSNPVNDDDLARKGYVDTILGSAQEAETSATQAATSATNAANSASAASTSASQASSSATSASSSATSATASASSASSSAASASSSATASATSASEASTSAANAESAWDSFDDRYLGAKATDPTVDNDGNALVVGAMYFDSTNNVTKLYNGTEWQAASSSIDGIKTDFVYTATAGQTVFSGNDDNTNELVIDKVGLANVYLNGVRLSDSDYTASAPSNSITLATGASVGDSVEVEVFGNFAGQSGADVAITGGSITGVTLNATGFTSTGIDDNATSTAITIDASENVGIGTNSPDSSVKLHVQGAIGSTNGTASAPTHTFYGDSNTGMFRAAVDTLGWSTGGTERARIDSSGNLLVGTTTSTPYADSSGTGMAYRADFGIFSVKSAGIQSIIANRTGSDGTIAEFRKDGLPVGSINSIAGSYLAIGTNDTGLAFNDDDDTIVPWDISANDNRRDIISLGSSSQKFKDLYLYGGVYLGGTGAANKLDDYETGTFSLAPEVSGIRGTTTNPTYTISRDANQYIKIGDYVTLYIDTWISGLSSEGAGSLYLVPPFTSANIGSGGEYYGAVAYSVNFDVEPYGYFVDNGLARIYLTERNGALLNTSALSSTTRFRFSVTYRAA